MNVEDEWVLFLEEHPEFFQLSKSGFFISLLDSLESEAKSFEAITARFPKVDAKDMQLVLSALVELRVVEKLSLGDKFIFAVTEKGRLLLQRYKKAKRFFEV